VDELVDKRGERNMIGEEKQTIWPELAARLRTRLPEATWNSSFATARPLVLDDHRLILAVPHSIAKERIESRYLELITDVALEVTGQRITVSIEVLDPGAAASPLFDFVPQVEPRELRPQAAPIPEHTPQLPFAKHEGLTGDLVLNPRYTFADFVIGSSNRFAHAAAMSVAETPARSYNPLFIYGESGLGKTHLLQAIAHYVRENYKSSRIRYVSTETFMNEFVDAIKTNTTGGFKRRYRDDCDVLLIDDIQFMEGKEGTQEEFFHTFNFLHQSGRQIVISSDRPPKNIATLEDRLRSRFEWGLITDVQPPEIETRLAILRKKAERERTAVPDDVFTFIGTHIKDNIRELEGALNRVCAYAGLNRVQLDLPMAERVLSDLLSGNEPRPVTAKTILNATADMFGFSITDLIGQSRRRPLVTARQVGMYVFRELTDFSYPMIGREFGDRDHTTVIHAVEKITEQMKERRAIYDQVSELIRVIKTGG
jgi:chromosomal replication initiator protein